MSEKKFLKCVEILQKAFGLEQTLENKRCTDGKGNPLPWYTYPAIEYLTQFDYTDKRVFEYGCATSSLFWAKRAKEVIGVEDQLCWFEKWQAELNAPNLQILYREQASYADSIAESQKLFDVIVIDGADREACARVALSHLSANGFLIFDDSDRANKSASFANALKLLKDSGLLQVDFYGFCPTSVYPKTTSLFLRRSFDFKTLQPIQPMAGIGSLWGCSRTMRKKLYKIELGEN